MMTPLRIVSTILFAATSIAALGAGPGPRMTDEEFFNSLDLAREDLAGVRKAVEARDLDAAKAAFLAHMRSRRRPKWWFDWRDRPNQEAPVTGGSEGWDYFSTRIRIDWTGWKELTLPLKDWRRARKPIGWHHINSLAFSSTFGGLTASPETVLVFDRIELAGDEPASLGDFETAEDFRRWDGLQPTTKHVKVGEQAGMWSQLPLRPGVRLGDLPHDWRKYDALRLWLYSAKATGDVITRVAQIARLSGPRERQEVWAKPRVLAAPR